MYTINSLREELYTNINQVYQIFKDFYGEQFVDLQGVYSDDAMRGLIDTHTNLGSVLNDTEFELTRSQLAELRRHIDQATIMVWWPSVTVTNEHNRSVQIQDLYAKIGITVDGRIPYENHGFLLNRTTFPEIQFTSGYLHSHVPHFGDMPTFSVPCLGTGPIRGTIIELKNHNELPTWMMFCHELALYVTVESLRGVPYFKLETIGSSRKVAGYNNYDYDEADKLTIRGSDEDREEIFNLLKRFAKYYLQHGHLTFSYMEGSFKPGLSYYDFIIDISNSFIEYFNQVGSTELYHKLNDKEVLTVAIASNGKFYKNSNHNNRNVSAYEGRAMFEFKGEMKHLHITHREREGSQVSTLLSHYAAMCILRNILKIINYRFENNYDKQQHYSRGSSPTAYQTVCYI